jgi:hypothetical protein
MAGLFIEHCALDHLPFSPPLAPDDVAGLFIEHCALDHGAVFMDSAIEQITSDILEAVAPDDEWDPGDPLSSMTTAGDGREEAAVGIGATPFALGAPQ